METISQINEVLGTQVEIKIPKSNNNLFFECFKIAKEIEKKYSRFLEKNHLWNINKNIGKWQKIDLETLFLIQKAVEFKEKTHGNFDITLKRVLDKMGYDNEYSFKEKETLENEFQTNIENPISINMEKEEIFLKKEIEFGGFGKGYFLDKAAEFFNKKGLDHYYINAGGDIFAKKGKGNEEWEILLEHPDNQNMAIGKVKLDNNAIAASAPNKRKWGKMHHLLNAKTKKPASEVKAIFIMAKTGIEADAYATALFGAGFNSAIEIANNLPIEMLIVSKENKMYKTPDFEVEFFS